MTMDEKNELVINYINDVKTNFEKNGYPVSNEAIKSAINRYTNSNKSFDEIKKEIDELTEERLEEISKRNKLIENIRPEDNNINNLKVDHVGITLNEQDIDLMMIANAKDLNGLKAALKKINNISVELPDSIIEEDQFKIIRQEVYDLYMNSLTPKNEYFANKKIKLDKQLEYLKNHGIIDSDDLEKIEAILEKGNPNQILDDFKNTFSEEKSHQIFLGMKKCSPIEKAGIRGTDIETFQKMFEEMNNNYNSITSDESAKFGNVALPDGTFYFDNLKKVLDFAKDNGKQVRLNTLLFYMDCPDYLYNLPVTEENKERVKQVLLNYVKETTAFIKNNGYEETVRSIDVFNELLNRFAMDGDTPYKYRGDILQDPNVKDFDNIKSGWLKFLNIEDLCDVISEARKNLPNTDFMYNDDNLTDPKKIPATTEILNRIKQYEKNNNIKLIDSIGEQLHIDNNITKEQMTAMFDNLAQYRLPIEITEFDMVMTEINGLREDEINDLRISKINEIFDSIAECQEKDNIRGFTIWSKTDAQNHRVALSNEQRIREGQEPITTLHGGFYNNNMSKKTSSKKKTKFQEFNYHTHTARSGHSEIVSDEEILESAKEAGITTLGFSEHVPNPNIEFPDEDHRMLLSEVDGYIESINKMKEANKDMTILAGFEAEFDPMKEAFLGDMRDKVDYMILGQHFVKDGTKFVTREGNPDYPIKYAEMVCKGIDSGLFDIVAHPDCFMEGRDTISENDKAAYEENCIKASHMICEKAAKMGIPIEINMGNALNNKFFKDGNLGIPHPLFWDIAKEYNVKVLKGIDAHNLQSFKDLDKGEALISNIEQLVSDKMIKGPYDPVVARKNNPDLQKAYKTHQEEALTYETHLVSKIVNGTLASISDNQDSEDMAIAVGTALNGSIQRCVDGADRKEKLTAEDISTITDSKEISIKEKKAKLERKKQVLNETKQVLANQQRVIENAKNNVVNAANIGCESKEEYSNVVTQMTQQQTTNRETQKMRIEQNLSNFQNSKTKQKANQQSVNKPKVMKKTNNNKGKNTSSSGFTNTITLALIVSFICGVLFMITCMLINR